MRGRGRLVEVEVDHRIIPYADFHMLVIKLGGRVLSREGWWPIAKYKLSIPKKRRKELLEEIKRLKAADTVSRGGQGGS